MNTEKLRGVIAERGMTGAKLAPLLNMSSKTFYSRMKKGNFTLSEAETLARILRIPKPGEIFFA